MFILEKSKSPNHLWLHLISLVGGGGPGDGRISKYLWKICLGWDGGVTTACEGLFISNGKTWIFPILWIASNFWQTQDTCGLHVFTYHLIKSIAGCFSTKLLVDVARFSFWKSKNETKGVQVISGWDSSVSKKFPRTRVLKRKVEDWRKTTTRRTTTTKAGIISWF